MSPRLRLLAGIGLVWLHGCTAPNEDVSRHDSRLDHEGPWSIPEATLARGDEQSVPYAGAGPWNEGADCAGGLSPGAAILRRYLLEHFPQTRVIGGYNCRPNTANTAQMSIHAVGRALDVMLPRSRGSADNDLGDPIGAWLIENAELLGIQYVIWDEWTWSASRAPGTKGRAYTGPNPHHDHLHVELGAEAGARTEDWFSGLVVPPTKEGCVPLGPAGGVIDDLDPCFRAYGSSAYWRHEVGVGHGGSLIWTNAYTSTTPGNWARWDVALAEAGDYEVDVFLSEPFAVFESTRYVVRASGVDHTLVVDQASEVEGEAAAWVSLGVHAFATGADQAVSVYDDSATTVASDQHIVVDAIRLSRIGAPVAEEPIGEAPTPEGDPDPELPPDEAPIASPRGSGCDVTVGASSGPGLGIVLLAAVLARRRRVQRATSQLAR